MKKKITFLITIGMVLYVPFLFAHSPNLSSLMIYEQNGKNILVIKSSLAAFEGEIDYLYKKEAYKTPQEFIELVIRHFKKSCVIMINNDTALCKNIQIQLGHETTLFAELDKVPKKISSCSIKNDIFKDMPNNLCELILNFNGIEQKQTILSQENKYVANLKVKNNQWEIDEKNNVMVDTKTILLLSGILLVILIIILYNLRNSAYSFALSLAKHN